MSGQATSERPLGLAPEVALTALTLAAAVSLGRLFSTATFLGPVALAVVSSHLLAAVCRRLGLGVPATTLVSALSLVLGATWLLAPSSTVYGIPTAQTWQLAAGALSEAWQRFGTVMAPVQPEPGFVLAGLLGTWVAAFLSDWAAFRANAPFEAVVPPFSLFIFAASLGTPRHRTATTLLFLAALLAFLLVDVAATRAEAPWLASRRRGGPKAIVRAGAALTVVTVAAALLLGPLLPGAGQPALLQWRTHGSGEGSRVTVSPLVDIRGRLLSQSDQEVFTVRSTVRSYWRLTSLDSFDGRVWGSKGAYGRASGRLGLDVPIDVEGPQAVQTFAITGLESIWLPAAYRPTRFEGSGDVSFDPDSASLLTEAASPNGLVYRVRSTLPRLTASQLARAPEEVPERVRRHYTSLPVGFPRDVTLLARTITAGASSPYAQALALQAFFRDHFTYSTEVLPGHDDAAIERFLRSRRGYCEQFAGTYGAMARAIGLRARVAVGFTPGELGPDGQYHVTGRHAHAWPEVFIASYGWVAFEPTPGRGGPGAEAYTGVREQQETSGAPAGATPTPGAATPGTAAPGAIDRPRPEGEAGPRALPPTPSLWPGRLRIAGLGALGALGAWTLSVPLALAARRRRRRARAREPSARTLVAWEEALEALAIAGAARDSAETNTEYAARAATTVGIDRHALIALAADATAACFAADGVDPELEGRAIATSARVVAAARSSAGRRRRLLAALDPRPLRPTRVRANSSGAGGKRSKAA